MSHLDTVFRALAHPLRREALAVLSGRDDGVARVEELTDELLDASGAESTARLHAALHHTHLPALVDAGIVEYDARSGLVRYREGQPKAELIESAIHSPRSPCGREPHSSDDS
jgi:DNA-binding transcriptional ArsR family regulator